MGDNTAQPLEPALQDMFNGLNGTFLLARLVECGLTSLERLSKAVDWCEYWVYKCYLRDALGLKPRSGSMMLLETLAGTVNAPNIFEMDDGM